MAQTQSTPHCVYCLLHHPHQGFQSRAQACEFAQNKKIAELQQLLEFETKELDFLTHSYGKLKTEYEKERSGNDLEQLQIQARDLKRSIRRMERHHQKFKGSGFMNEEEEDF